MAFISQNREEPFQHLLWLKTKASLSLCNREAHRLPGCESACSWGGGGGPAAPLPSGLQHLNHVSVGPAPLY